MNFGPPITHLLVDLDGTLLGNRSIPLSIDFVTKAMKRLHGYTGWRKAARILLETQLELTRASATHTNDLRVVELFARRLRIHPDEARRILRESLSVLFPGLERHFYPMPGAKEFLDWAKDRYTLTLATNPVWPAEIIDLRVRWAGIDPRIFEHVTHVRAMRACKPSRQYYEQLLAIRKVCAEECLLVGNDVRMDLPATRVGIRVFIVGKYKRVSKAKVSRAKALGWKGSFAHLRSGLEEQADQR